MKQKIELKPYQRAILDDLAFMPSIALFMGTGSGKTYTSLFRVKENPTNQLLVICPAKVVNQWMKNIPDVLEDYKVFEFSPRSSAKQKNAELDKMMGERNAIVVSLETIYKLDSLKELIDNRWTIIVDESHKIKETGTFRSPVKVTQAVLKLGVRTDFKIILTATPTQKEQGGYIDYYSQLRFLGYMNITKQQFMDRYCKLKDIYVQDQRRVKKIVGYRRTEEIENLLSMFSRSYIPSFTDDEPRHIKVDIDTAPSYNKFIRERYYEDLDLQNTSAMRIAKKTLTSGTLTGRDIFGDIKRYRDNTNKIDWVKEFLSNTDETIVIFYKYNVELDLLKETCEELDLPYIVVNGANKTKTEDINTKEYRVVLGQFNACGESVDGLQYKSHIVVYYSMPESSLEYKQSLGRINRIGQEKLPIYYHLVMSKTIDEAIYEMTLSKVEFNEEVLNRLSM